MKEEIKGSTDTYGVYIGKKEAAAYLGLSKPTIERLIRKGLPTYKPGGKILLKKQELDAFMQQFRAVQSTNLKERALQIKSKILKGAMHLIQ